MITLKWVDNVRPTVLIEREAQSDSGAWSQIIQRLSRGLIGGNQVKLEIYSEVFFSELSVLKDVKELFKTTLQVDEDLTARLRGILSDKNKMNAVQEGDTADPESISQELESTDYRLRLKDFQLRNLSRIIALPHSADFSVPGSGKTAVALANFALHRSRGEIERMLVVAPIAAFESWKEETSKCFSPDDPLRVDVHLGPNSMIPATSDLLVTNYHRLASDYDRLNEWVRARPTQVVLDEAHRVKQGAEGVHGRAALDLAWAAKRRDVLSGTPAPQGAHDLVALMDFLYPGRSRSILPAGAFIENQGFDEKVLAQTHEATRKFFVRTRKLELGLPETRMTAISRPMGPLQSAIYDGLIGHYRGQFQLRDNSRREFRRLGRIVMYLLEAATNPLLLLAGHDPDDIPDFTHPPLALTGDEQLSELLSRYSEFETPWKYQETIRLVSEAASKGDKILIWSSFVRNIRHLEKLLVEWNPAVVHGGVPPRDGASQSATRIREDELDRFKNDSDCAVLLANPAACGEGVSLHHWCHHAVYLDRTFNAGHFLQSQDRIHRLGLPDDTVTQFTLLLSEGSIDVPVGDRLRDKIIALSQLMNDPGLVRLSLPSGIVSDPLDQDTDSDLDSVDDVEQSDIGMILEHIEQSS